MRTYGFLFDNYFVYQEVELYQFGFLHEKNVILNDPVCLTTLNQVEFINRNMQEYVSRMQSPT